MRSKRFKPKTIETPTGQSGPGNRDELGNLKISTDTFAVVGPPAH